jgi:hypothetical protein
MPAPIPTERAGDHGRQIATGNLRVEHAAEGLQHAGGKADQQRASIFARMNTGERGKRRMGQL